MTLDVLVRNGLILDGSGAPGYIGDVGIRDGVIVDLGDVTERSHRYLEAEGHVVTPGFIDGHTHMDAQVFWDDLGSNSCWHGVTTVLMGNCGFTLAPARSGQVDLVLRNLERAEDIPRSALIEGINWSWESFGEYLGAVEKAPKAINYGCFIGHSALRTWAMGERAFESTASTDDLDKMERGLLEGLREGAFGFTTSQSPNHETAFDQPVASRLSSWSELAGLASVMAQESPFAVFAFPSSGMLCRNRVVVTELRDRLIELSRSSPITVMFPTSTQTADGRDQRDLLDLLTELNQHGRAFGQVASIESALLLSFRSRMPFDSVEAWRGIRSLPMDRQAAVLRSPERRQQLLDAAEHGLYGRAVGAEAKRPDYAELVVMQNAYGSNPTVGEMAHARGVSPLELIVDLALETDLQQGFLQLLADTDRGYVLRGLASPHTVLTSTDSGAHVNQICGAALHTRLFAELVRDSQAIPVEKAVQLVTSDVAAAFGIHGRGQLKPGYAADLNIIDLETIGPTMPQHVSDLPGGAMRITQKAAGIRATIVNGVPTLLNGEPTGAHPGALLRRNENAPN